MMSTLTIENIPPELQFRLTQEATRYHRSLTQQVLVLLELGLIGKTNESPYWTIDDVAKRWLDPIKPTLPISSDSVIELIRETRDEMDMPMAHGVALAESYNQRGTL